MAWRSDSHLNDDVVGGWYDAGDFLKLNFPLAPTVGLLAWGMIEFKDAYVASGVGVMSTARNNLRIAADYLHRCWDPVNQTYVGQIGAVSTDHNYWGRPEDQNVVRPALVYNTSMPAADLLGAVAGALAATSVVFNGPDTSFSQQVLNTAQSLYSIAVVTGGKYSDFYRKDTHSIYPSADFKDSLAFAAGWLYRATGNTSYLDQALKHWGSGSGDVFCSWDSLWALHAVHMSTLVSKGVPVPGGVGYVTWAKNTFLKAWINANGYQDIISTPRGMHYAKWNSWGTLAMSTEAAALALLNAKYETDPGSKASQVTFARSQIDYALGFDAYRSFVVGFGNNPPQFAHHAAASCPDPPAICDWSTFASKTPNFHTLYGALVGGPAGQRKNATDPDNTYNDRRNDYVTNEVANDCTFTFVYMYFYLSCI